MLKQIIVAIPILIAGAVAADEVAPCINLELWDDAVQRTLTLARPALSGGLELVGYRPRDRALEFVDSTTGETLAVPLDDAFELSVARTRQEQSMLAQEAYWEVEEQEYEAATRVIPLDRLAVKNQRLHAGNPSGCAARPEDGASFEVDRLWVEGNALQAEGSMMHYERVYPGGDGDGGPPGDDKGG